MKTLKTNEMAAREAATENVRVLNCTNLHAVEGGAALRPEGAPTELAAGGRVPLAVCTTDDGGGEITVYARGSELALVSSGLATATADTGSEQMAAVADGSRLHVLTPRKHLIYKVSPEALTAETPPRAVVRFATEADSSLVADVGAVQLSRTYSAGESAADADSRRLSSLLATTLDRLDRDSRAAGLWWMPTLMAVRLRDSHGRTVLTTPPMLVASADGACCDGVLELYSDDGRTTAATSLAAPAWRVKATVDSMADCDLMAEVLATPMLQRLDSGATAAVAMRRRADDRYFCRATMPTAPTAVWAGGGAARADALADMAGAFDRVARVVATARLAARGSLSIDVRPPVSGDILSDISSLTEAMAAPAPTDAFDLGWVAAPHSFTASAVAAAPGAALLAGLTVNPFEGFLPQCYAATTVRGKAWHAAARVTFADGSSRTVTAEGDDFAPERFGPVLAYPSPLATSLYLTVRVGATVRCGLFPLRPDKDRRRAIYVAPSLCPAELPDTAAVYVVPAENPLPLVYDDVMAVADDGLTALTAVQRVALGRVNAMIAANHAQGAWDYGRARFYVMTSSGIYSAAVASGGKSLSMSMVDNRTVERADAVARAGEDVYAVASADLIRLRAASVKTVVRDCGARLLAWNGRRGRLWLIPPQGDIEVLDPATGRRTLLAQAWQPQRVATVGGRTYIADDSRVAEVGPEQPFVERSVRWTLRVRTPTGGRFGRERTLAVDMSGHVGELHVDVRRVFIDRRAPASTVAMTVRGEVHSGLRRRFCARGSDFEINISGSVGPDFLLERVSI